MSIIAYHGTKVDFDEFRTGDTSIDRMVGPHFSQTPELANRFALKNPGRKGSGKRYGGRVIPVRLDSAVYVVNQLYSNFPGRYSKLTHPENGTWIGLFGMDYVALAYDIGRTVLPVREDLRCWLGKVWDVPGDKLLQTLEQHNSWDILDILGDAYKDLQRAAAEAYRDILVGQGYGVIQYVNTAKKEQVGGLREQTCFIALQRPRFLFE